MVWTCLSTYASLNYQCRLLQVQEFAGLSVSPARSICGHGSLRSSPPSAAVPWTTTGQPCPVHCPVPCRVHCPVPCPVLYCRCCPGPAGPALLPLPCPSPGQVPAVLYSGPTHQTMRPTRGPPAPYLPGPPARHRHPYLPPSVRSVVFKRLTAAGRRTPCRVCVCLCVVVDVTVDRGLWTQIWNVNVVSGETPQSQALRGKDGRVDR